MRFLAAICLVLSLATHAESPAPRKSTAPVQISGQKYMSLHEWATSKELQLAREGNDVSLTNRTARVHLKVNSARADVDGVSVFLAFPILLREGTVWMAQKDVERSLAPLLFPPKNKVGDPVRVIAISAGHGGKDPGYVLGSHLEKKYTLLLAKELQRRCARAGLKTVLVRDSDIYLTLADRTRLAKAGKADVYIELHYNCGAPGNRVSKGVEVYCLTLDGAASTNGGSDRYPAALAGNQNDERNLLLAYNVHKSIVTRASMADRGVRRARFEVLRDAQMPAVLIEGGFMSQPDDMRAIQDAGRRRRTAQAILDGILAYKRSIDP